MASPLPPDPYVALGVAQDADVATIRTAHRKLALKHHPDRIRDEAQRELGKLEFQKIQQAYELLVDPTKRARYDDKVKLAELQKERMLRDREAARSSMNTSRASPPNPNIRREMRDDGQYYEDRAPPTSYFEDRERFDEPLPRTSARKYDAGYEKKPSTPRSTEKKEKVSSKWTAPVDGISYKMAFHMKNKAGEARERVKEGHAQKTEVRDREKRRERNEKQSSRRTAYVDEYESDASDSNSFQPRYSSNTMPPQRPRPRAEPEPVRTRGSSRRVSLEEPESHSDYESKWERHHKNSREYIAESQKRPAPSRVDSDAYRYWEGDGRGGRRSGSDTEKRGPASKGRRSGADEGRPRPAMPVHTSAPSNLRPQVVDRAPNVIERGPQRSSTGVYPPASERREPPSLSRAQTMPTSRSAAKKEPSSTGSKLKHGETQDSGYYSSSNPHTPEMRSDSPARDTSKRNPRSTRYQIVDPSNDDEATRRPRVTRLADTDDEAPSRRYRSPEPDTRERERDRDRRRDRPERPRLDTEMRSRTTRVADGKTSVSRGEFARYESSPRGSPTVSRLFGEVSPDREQSTYGAKYEQPSSKTSGHRSAAFASYAPYRGREGNDDHVPGSQFREQIHHPTSRRPSVAY